MPACKGAGHDAVREGRDRHGVRVLREVVMGYAIMIVGILALLVGAVWGARKLAQEDTEEEGEEDGEP